MIFKSLVCMEVVVKYGHLYINLGTDFKMSDDLKLGFLNSLNE